jgi:hypothetical protein
MKDRIMKMIKKILSTTTDLKDAALGYERVKDAERRVDYTLKVLEARKQSYEVPNRQSQKRSNS